MFFRKLTPGPGVTHYRGVDVSFASLEVFIQRLQELNTAGPRRETVPI
jgi:hypothetical protein